MSLTTPVLPNKLLIHLRMGAPALLLTMGGDGYPNLAYTWAAAPDARRVRFGADHGSATLANLQRDGRASLQFVGPGNLAFLVKGAARTIKDRIAAAPFRIALMEIVVAEAKDQSWPGVTVSPLTYEWPADRREAMLEMEQSVYAELRDWEPETTGRMSANY
jgi:Pyridoxamine 5'-phosphate oxidase